MIWKDKSDQNDKVNVGEVVEQVLLNVKIFALSLHTSAL